MQSFLRTGMFLGTDTTWLTCFSKLIDLAPNVWLHSSVGRASHRYRGGHGFKSHWSPDFFRLLLSSCLNWKLTAMIIPHFLLTTDCFWFYFEVQDKFSGSHNFADEWGKAGGSNMHVNCENYQSLNRLLFSLIILKYLSDISNIYSWYIK